MITHVYCCICLLIPITIGHSVHTEDYENDSPDFQPKQQFLRHRIGSDVMMKCSDIHQHAKDKILWEFRRCGSNYKGIQCDQQWFTSDTNDPEWMRLDYAKGKKKLEIRNSSEDNNGIYRCLCEDVITTIYVVEIVAPAKYRGPPPEVVSLVSTNYTVNPNSHVVIMCQAQSNIPPEIRWFKECKQCDIWQDDHCYCSIMGTQNPVHAMGNNLYMSKFNIYNAKSTDSGVYVCLAISLYGKDHKNVTIKVHGFNEEMSHKSFSLLFLIPLGFLLVPVTVWLCYYKRKQKCNGSVTANDQQKNLIKPVVKFDIVLLRDEVV